MKQKKIKNQSISDVLQKFMRFLFINFIILVWLVCFVFQLINTTSMTKKTLKAESVTVADHISWVIKTYKTIVEDLGTDSLIADPDTSIQTKIALLEKKRDEFNLGTSGIIRSDGFSDIDQNYRGNRDYFEQAMSGDTVVSDPLISRTTGRIVLVAASPVWKNAEKNTSVTSVVFTSLEPEILNSIVNSITISRNSNAYIISNTGTVIASKKDALVVGQTNHIRQAEFNKKFRKISAFEKNAISSDCTSQTFFYEGRLTCFVSATIEEIPGWTVVIESPVTDFFIMLYSYILSVIIIIVLSLVLINSHSKIIARTIAEPVQKMALRLQKASEGDFSSEVDQIEDLKEVRIISEATQSLVNRMDLVINNDENYRNTVKLSDLIDFESLNAFIRGYDTYMDAIICVKDVDGKVIVGVPGTPTSRHFSENILIHERKIGSMELYTTETCRFTPQESKDIIKLVASTISNIADANLRNHMHFNAMSENFKVNIRSLMSKNEKIAVSIHNWLETLEHTNYENKKDFTLSTNLFAAQAREYLELLDDTQSFVDFSEFNTGKKESDYSIDELTESLYQSLNSNSQLKISVSKDVPDYMFGERETLEKILSKIIQTIRLKDIDIPIFLGFAAATKGYALILEIEITYKASIFTDEERNRIRSLIMSSSQTSGTTYWEQNLKNALRLMKQMNGEAEIFENEEGFCCFSMKIPQLDAGKK